MTIPRNNFWKSFIGRKYEKLTVLSRAPDEFQSGKCTRFVCLCDCGNTTIVAINHLQRTKSCGCIIHNPNMPWKKSELKGQSRTPLYKIWQAMRDRCYNEANKFYKYYGGRGIKVSEEWWSYDGFYKWANEHGYVKGLDLDRTDNNGDYSPNNCRFVTHSENLENTRRRLAVIVDGKEASLASLARKYDVPYSVPYSYYVHLKNKEGDVLVGKIQQYKQRHDNPSYN